MLLSTKANESSFWKRLKKRIESEPGLVATRIENSSTPGIPDLLICDRKKNLHLIELKVCLGNKVNLSPHQVSFATRHQCARVWVLAEKQNAPGPACYLYRSNSVLQLASSDIKTTAPDLIFDLKTDFKNFICWLENSTKLWDSSDTPITKSADNETIPRKTTRPFAS